MPTVAESPPSAAAGLSPIAVLRSFWIRHKWALRLTLALVCGILFRLIWPFDIEFKGDEAWMFERTQTVGVTEPWPLLGMPTCSVFRNPGMNVWIFVALGRLFSAADPPALAQAVQIMNVSAILLLIVFIYRLVPKEDREPWLWAAALVSLNPLAVLFHRKIWQPCVFPLFSLLFLAAWWRRERLWGAFLWGLIGACLGQIQMAGFFFAAGFVAWAVLFDRKNVHWKGWFAGSAVGAIPLLPWLSYMLTREPHEAARDLRFEHIVEGKFWLRWITDPFGISLHYSLENDFGDFLRYPLVGGTPTYLVLALHVALVALAVVMISRSGYYLWQKRADWGAMWIGKSPTAFTQNAALWGFGILLTISLTPVNRHYLLVATPLTFVWLARHALQDCSVFGGLRLGRGLLLTLCVMTGLITANFLSYVHINQRRINGDYGMPYGAQVGWAPPTALHAGPPTVGDAHPTPANP